MLSISIPRPYSHTAAATIPLGRVTLFISRNPVMGLGRWFSISSDSVRSNVASQNCGAAASPTSNLIRLPSTSALVVRGLTIFASNRASAAGGESFA
jgi:hypothetical protein